MIVYTRKVYNKIMVIKEIEKLIKAAQREAIEDYKRTRFVIEPEDLSRLQNMILFDDSKELVDKILALGTVKVQGREFQLTEGQIKFYVFS